MKKKRKATGSPRLRTEGQINFVLLKLKQALFDLLVPAYTEIRFDGTSDEDAELNKRVVYAAGRLLHSGRFSDCPECEKILMVGAKSTHPFVHFHELLKELKRHGA